jgi:hypothetical protein
VLNEVWYFLNERGRWPTFLELDQRLYRNCDLQIDEVCADIPPDLLHHSDAEDTGAALEFREVALTVAGVQATGRGRRELDIFRRAVVLAAEIQRDYEPSPDHPGMLPILTSASVARRTGTDDEPMLRRVGALLRVEPWGGTVASGSAEHWVFAVGRQVRRFRDMTSIPEYLRLRKELVEPDAGAASPAGLPAAGRTLVEWLTIVLAAVGTYLAGLQVQWHLTRTGSLVVLLTCSAFSAYSWRRGTDRRIWRHAVLWAAAALSAVFFIWSFLG